jgi:hypothetical protein
LKKRTKKLLFLEVGAGENAATALKNFFVSFFQKRRASLIPRTIIAIFFILIVTVIGWNVPAYDLRASYVAGKLIATRQTGHIYDQVGRDSAHDDGSPWAIAAQQGGLEDRVVTAYVQAPLWAYVISPLAALLDFSTFKRLFIALAAAATVGTVFAATRQWTPSLASPRAQTCVLAVLFCTIPFYDGIVLGQTHMLFLYVVICAMVAEQRGRPVLAGVLLALGAYTKITPVWIALTWLVRGNWRAASSFAVSSAVLLAVTIIVGGLRNFMRFMHILQTTAHSAFLTFNNDSLAALLLQKGLNPQTAFHFEPVAIPAWLSLLSVLAIAASAVAMGVRDRSRGVAYVGPIFTLVAATLFTPLAWNHYFVVLVLPMILVVDAAIQEKQKRWIVLAALVVALNVPPLAYAGGSSLWIVSLRSQFWAAMLCLVAMLALPNKTATANQKSFASFL